MRHSSAIPSCHVIRGVTSAMLVVVLLTNPHCSGQRCKLSKSWRGRYYQSGIGETYVRETRITTKGACIDRNGAYFLFHNRENHCYQCLHIIQRHPNLLQYQESYCSLPDTLSSVCSNIRHNSPYTTLLREPAQLMECSSVFGYDFGYTFDYNDHTYGFCSRLMSYASPCVNHTTQRLHFNHCVPLATFNGQDIFLECLATWTEDSELFLLGKLIGIDAENEEYRCFKYSKEANDQLFVAMGADSTCRGLRSSKDGQFVMELTRDTFGWPSAVCSYPDWLDGVQWRDISGTLLYSFSASGQQIIQVVRYGANISSSTQSSLVSAYRCIQTLDFYQLDEEFIFLSFSTHGCDSKYQCLKIRRRSRDSVEFNAGGFVDHWSRDRCVTEAGYNSTTVLVAERQPTGLVSCPHPGVYYMTGPAGGCVYRVDIGCHNDSVVYVESAAVCSGHSSLAGFASRYVWLECRDAWQSGSTVYLVVRDRISNKLICLHFVLEEGVLTLVKDDMCNLKASKMQTFNILRRDDCQLAKITEPNTRVDSFQTPGSRQRFLAPHPEPPSRTVYEREAVREIYNEDDEDRLDDTASGDGASNSTTRGQFDRREDRRPMEHRAASIEKSAIQGLHTGPIDQVSSLLGDRINSFSGASEMTNTLTGCFVCRRPVVVKAFLWVLIVWVHDQR